MLIEPLAFDSMGVRSMATFVRTKDLKILIDPGAALGPRRYGLPPHPVEIRALELLSKRIEERALEADVIVVTHYHYDHHNLGDRISLDIYRGKLLFIKDPDNMINFSQGKRRAPLFLEKIRGLPTKIDVAEENSLKVGDTVVKFSKAVTHGANSRLGYVVEVYISDGKMSFLHSSDVEGPVNDEQVEFILDMNPEVLFLDGPMTYMLGYRFSQDHLRKAMELVERIVEETDVKKIVWDHHLLRDLDFRSKIADAVEHASGKGVKIVTAAEFLGERNNLLEARRRELYGR